MTDELTLKVGGRAMSGWTSVRVSRGIERCPSDFEISLTERFPGEAESVSVQPGDECVVLLGSDPVITGYVDRTGYAISAGQHTLTVTGRSKCADLVDCSAIWPGMQIAAPDAFDIAEKLAKPFGITVQAPGRKGLRVEKFNINPGDTAWTVIEKCCRWGALLVYDLPDGNLILSEAGKETAASGFTQGVNVQLAGITYSSDQRYSEYICFAQGMEAIKETGDGLDLAARAKDPGVTRNRPLVIINETPSGGLDFSQHRIDWEANRRIGRAAQLHVTTDSWRDSAGALWTPNTLAPLALPILKCGTEQEKKMWLIAEVAYRRDDSGTSCDLVLMPPEAFLPQPILQMTVFQELGQQP